MSNNEVLRKCDFFASLTSSDIDKINTLASEKEYEAGALMFQARDQAELLFVLKEGKVALQMASAIPPGRTITVDLATSGEIVGWAPLVEPYIHDLTALCLQRSRVLAIDAIRLRVFLKQNNQAYTTVLKGMIHAALLRLSDTRQLLVSERFWLQKIE